MRADSCSGPTTDSICGHGLGRMGHSSNFARWPHLGPIPPMDGGGHLVPLSYVYGYRGGVGRRGVAQDTIGDNGLEIRARVRRYQLILSRCAAGFVPKSAISEISRSGQRKNGRSGGNFLSDIGCAWAVLGGIPSGWGQFGAVKKLLSFIGGLRRQLNALYIAHLAGLWFSYVATTFLVRAPQTPKDLGFRVFSLLAIPLLLVPSIWPKNACVMPNSKSGVTKYVATKIRYNGFLK